MLLLLESVLSLKEKATTQHWFSYFQIDRKYLKYFITHPLNIIIDDFGI